VDALVTVLPGFLATYIVNLTLATAAGAFVLFLLARRRPVAATVDLTGGSHVAAHNHRRRVEPPSGIVSKLEK